MSADDGRKGDEMDQPSEALPLIGQIAKLKLRRGDALVLKTDQKLSARECDEMHRVMNIYLGTIGLSTCIVPVLMLQEGMELQVLDARSFADLRVGESGEAEKPA